MWSIIERTMQQAMLTITASTTIGHPIADVFAILTEPRHARHWISLVFDAELNESAPIVAGSTAWYMVKVLGRRFRVEGEWLRYEPPYESVFQTTLSPLSLHVTYRCRETSTGTYAEITALIGSALFVGVTSGTVEKVMASNFAHDLALLKTYLEAAPRMFTLVDA